MVVESGVDVPIVVLAPAGVRVAGFWELDALDGHGGSMLSLALDETGRGKIRIRPGHWRLSLRLGDLAQRAVEVDVPVRDPVRFDLTR